MEQQVRTRKILVLDDDGDFRKLLKTFLGGILPDAEVIEYDPVAKGVPGADFDWANLDLLILDYDLHGTGATGLDVLQRNANVRFFPATIILTGAGSEDVAVRALRAGVYDYLRKQGLKKEQLKASVLGVMARHAADRDRLYSLDEARQLLRREAELIITSCRKKYEQMLKEETARFDSERARLETALHEHESRLNTIGDEKRTAEVTLQSLRREREELRSQLDAAQSPGKKPSQDTLQDALDDTVEKLKQTQEALDRTLNEQDRLKAQVDRMNWQREQEDASRQQFENDLRDFEADIRAQQEQYDKLTRRIADSAKERQQAAQLRKSQSRVHDQALFKDIGTQLDDNGRKSD